MSSLSKQFNLKSKKALVSGYAHETYGLIPTDLIKIIRWYMDEVLYWSMEGKFLSKFCSKKTGQILYSSTYNFEEIEFNCYWYPNGNSLSYKDQVIFGVTLSKLPKHIDSLTIYYRLQCKEFGCLWKSVHTFHNNEHTMEGNMNSSNNCIGWNPFNLKLSQCKTKKKIDFNCYINVLRIISNNGDKKCITECDWPSVLQVTKYEWIMSKAEMAMFHTCELGKTFYSENFGETDFYSLFMAPKGFNQDKNAKIDISTNQLMLYLRILRLPINIKSMRITYNVKAVYSLSTFANTETTKESMTVTVGYGFNECTKQLLLSKIPNILLLSLLQIYVKIQIQEIVDMNDKCIPKCHWEKYNITVNDSFSKIKKPHWLKMIKTK